MPFTLAHPIAAAPIWFLSKKRLNLPGLLVGAMIPDLEYFVALQPIRMIGHTLPGIFIQGIPCAIVLLLVFRYVLLRPFLALMPLQLARRFERPRSYFPIQLSQVLNIVMAIVIGAMSHLVWDEFTHANGWFVTRSTLLQSQLGSMSVYKWLQYGGGLFGVLALSVWLCIWLSQTKPCNPPQIASSLLKGLVAIWIASCTLFLAWFAVQIHHVIGESGKEMLVRSVIGSISGLFLGFLLYSIIFWLASNPKPDSAL